MTTLAPDEQFQSDVAARLSCDPTVSLITVLREQDGVSESDATLALGPARASGASGLQAGSLIVVQQTSDGSDVQPNVQGPREGFRITIRVLELPKLARQQPGYVSQFTVAKAIKASLHLFQLGTAPVLYVRGTPYNDGQGTVGKDLTFLWMPAPPLAKIVAQPSFGTDGQGNVTVASSTPGAEVFVTSDGSYPENEGNASPASFATPAAGTLLRAVAYMPGMIPSGLTEKQF